MVHTHTTHTQTRYSYENGQDFLTVNKVGGKIRKEFELGLG